MTVEELIDNLSKHDKDRMVVVSSGEEGFSEVSDVSSVDLALNVHTEQWNGEHELMEGKYKNHESADAVVIG